MFNDNSIQPDDERTPLTDHAATRRLGVELVHKHGGGYVLTAKSQKRAIENDWPALAERRAQHGGIESIDWSEYEPGLVPGPKLVDVDIDNQLALSALKYSKLPKTGFIHGRVSKARSHHWYRLTTPIEPLKLSHPRVDKDSNKQVILELRTGWNLQSKGPGGTHPSGEWYVFHENGDPSEVDSAELVSAVLDLAAMALVAAVWPGEGHRDEAAGALAAVLTKSGWSWSEIERFIMGVIEAAPTEDEREQTEVVHRIDFARRTYDKIQNGDNNVTGFGTLVDATGEFDAVRQAFGWLDLPATATGGMRIDRDKFLAYLPKHQYIYEPTGHLWPPASVNSVVAPVPVGRDSSGRTKYMKPSIWLDLHRPIHQTTWAPGMPRIVEDKAVHQGGWVDSPGNRVFNEYEPPVIEFGDPAKATRWVEHVRSLYADETDHLIKYFAFKVQFPGVKINHALVLGGEQGIGKDTLLYPVEQALGPWNVATVSPSTLSNEFTRFSKSVLLHVSEAHDLGDFTRYAFYERMKDFTAAPPLVLRCNEKYVESYYVPNVMGVVYTTNYKTTGLYLPSGDRRHFVAWSSAAKDDFPEAYWDEMYEWFESGGNGHVAAYLMQYDLSGFNPTAPPPKTEAWRDIVSVNANPMDAELTDIFEELNYPPVITIRQLIETAKTLEQERSTLDLGIPGAQVIFDGYGAPAVTWLSELKNRRVIPERLSAAGYEMFRNPNAESDGRWKIGRYREYVYARKDLPAGEHFRAVALLQAATEVGQRK